MGTFDTSWSARVSRHLYETRDIEGHRRGEAVHIAHELDKRLQDVPGFIGVNLFGSAMKGYADATSDIDVRVILDPSDTDTGATTNSVKAIVEELQKESDIPIQYSVRFISEAEIRLAMKNCKNSRLLVWISPLFRRIIGKRIHKMRDRVRETFHQMSSQDQEEFIVAVTNALQFSDWDASAYFDEDEKMESRLGNIPSEVGLQRKQMWEKRVRKILQ